MTPTAYPTDRQDYIELESIEDGYARIDKWNIFQVKYDGIWARIVIENNEATLYSRTGQVKHQFQIAQPLLSGLESARIVLVGEYMFGSQWAQDESRKGLIYAFDCIEFDGAPVCDQPYKNRYRYTEACVKALGGPFRMVECGGGHHLGGFWMRLEQKKDVEGIILRHWNDNYFQPIYKLKRTVQDDFVVMRVIEGTGKYAGMMGALAVGQYAPEGGLVEVMKVGGGFSDTDRARYSNPAEIVSRVILVEGKCRFESGAFRSPQYLYVRDDKKPEECLLKRTLQS